VILSWEDIQVKGMEFDDNASWNYGIWTLSGKLQAKGMEFDVWLSYVYFQISHFTKATTATAQSLELLTGSSSLITCSILEMSYSIEYSTKLRGWSLTM